MVYVSKSTPYMTLFKDFLAKKHKLAIDSWGADDAYVRHIYDPLVNLIKDNVADEKYLNRYPFPLWTIKERVNRVARANLLGEVFVAEWADHFKGFDEAKLDELAQSFKFENCLKRDGLNKVLTEHAQQVAASRN